VTELPKSSPEPASSKEPIVFVTDDDASMRRAVPVGNLNRLASEAESRNVSGL
jgi:hypothetical protein